MKKITGIIFLIALLTACGSVTHGLKYSSLTIPPIDQDKARIYFLHKDNYASPYLPINANGQQIGAVDYGSFFLWDTDLKEVAIDCGQKQLHYVVLKPKAGRTYYLSIEHNVKRGTANAVLGLGGLVGVLIGGAAVDSSSLGMVDTNGEDIKAVNNGSAFYQILPMEEKSALESFEHLEIVTGFTKK
jgi:hypothetical protein